MDYVIDQHLEEASFLWLHRDGALHAPHHALVDLARLDGRLEAHLDGLRVYGEQAWQRCLDALGEGGVGGIFASAVLAFESKDPERIEKVVQAAITVEGGVDSLVSALEWLPITDSEGHARQFLSRKEPALRRVGIAALAVHRRADAQILLDAIVDPDPLLQARALQSVGEMGHVALVREMQHFLSAEDDDVRFAVAWSTALLSGEVRALAVLEDINRLLPRNRSAGLELLFRRLSNDSARAHQQQLSRTPETFRLAATAAGSIGDPHIVPWLIEQMRKPMLARVAGEGFSTITGVHISNDKLEGKQPDGFNAGPTDDPEDENVEMDPDENLPWPDPELVQKWWDKNRGQFQNGTRYLLGKPMTIEWLQQVLRIGRQRQRAAAALELAIRQPGTPLFNVAAPGFRQQEMLGIKPFR